MTERSNRNVLDDHLQRRAEGDLESDLAHNYADDIVLLCTHGVFRGKDKVRDSADRLGLQLPGAKFTYSTVEVAGEMGFLEWGADSEKFRVRDGADSYLVRDGLIRAQTIHYTLEEE